jgi:hypothetical protein
LRFKIVTIPSVLIAPSRIERRFARELEGEGIESACFGPSSILDPDPG